MTPDPSHLRSLSTVTDPDPLTQESAPEPVDPAPDQDPARRHADVRRTSTATDFLDLRTAPVE